MSGEEREEERRILFLHIASQTKFGCQRGDSRSEIYVRVLPSSAESQLDVEEGVMFMPRKDWGLVLSVSVGISWGLTGTGWR